MMGVEHVTVLHKMVVLLVMEEGVDGCWGARQQFYDNNRTMVLFHPPLCCHGNVTHSSWGASFLVLENESWSWVIEVDCDGPIPLANGWRKHGSMAQFLPMRCKRNWIGGFWKPLWLKMTHGVKEYLIFSRGCWHIWCDGWCCCSHEGNHTTCWKRQRERLKFMAPDDNSILLN